MVEELLRRNILQRVEKFPAPDFFPPPNHINCTMIIKTFRPNELMLNTITLYGVISEPSLTSLDLMTHLSSAIEKYLGIFKADAYNLNMHVTALISDYISRKILTAEELEHKAAAFKLPYKANYCLHCYAFANYTISLAYYMLKRIKALYPYATLLVYGNYVLALINTDIGPKEDGHQAISQRELSYMYTSNYFCGISDRFCNLSELRNAYLQATAAIEVGRTLNPKEHVFRYSDYIIYHLLWCCGKEISLQNLYYKPLDVIRSDPKYSTDNMTLLETYLKNDRNVSVTAGLLHLHRNSVLYRLRKIEDMLGVSLDDPDLRLWLLLSFKTLHLLKCQT
jgi:sugar diacid utilization regulator